MRFEFRPIAAGVRHVFSRVDPWTLCILACGTALAAHAAWSLSVTHDESAHVPAGLAYWQFGAFDVYPHNPPFVKMCLSMPLFASGLRLDPGWLLRHPGPRYEWFLGQEFLRAHYVQARQVYFCARLISVAFYACGAWLVASWSRELFGAVAARFAAALWCFQPLVLAHASLATPDVGAAVLGLFSARAMVRHLKAPSWRHATSAGAALGLAELAKYTLLVLYLTWAIIALAAVIRRTDCTPQSRWRVALWLIYVPLVSLVVIGAGYAFTGVGKPLSSLTFLSSRFRSVNTALVGTDRSLARRIPLAVPRDYIEGLDRQWADVERGWSNYLHGKLSNRGWWSYYPLALLLKTPMAFWCLAAMAICAAWHGARAPAEDEASLALVPFLVAVVLEANTSLTFLRYLLPAVPFVCISISRVAAGTARARVLLHVATCLTVLTVLPPVLQHPRYLGYFNLAAGGPAGAWTWFSDGEIDWGQDLGALGRWQNAHSEARPIRLALFSPFSPPYPGLVDDTPEIDDGTTLRVAIGAMPRIPHAPAPGYLAISVTLLNRIAATDRELEASSPEARFCRWLKARPPLDLVGSSILIFHFSADDVSQWSKQSAK